MASGKLPPKPDLSTGLPRPPAAPLDRTWGHGHSEPTNRTTRPPDPPEGQGPALEWTTRSWNGFLGGVAFLVALSVVFLTLRNGGVSWVAYWVNWLIILALAAGGILFLVVTEGGLSAGAAWVRDGKKWVKTYELTEVRLGEPRAKSILRLRDADGREFSRDLMSLQDNTDLWDLVYNGMLHSVYYGGATINDDAREKLRLDPQLRFIRGDTSQDDKAEGNGA